MASRSLLSLIASLALAACATTKPIVDGGEVRNGTSSTLHSVRVVHEPTKRTVFASQILPGRALTLEFSPREMKAKYADFTWRVDGQDCSARVDAPACPPELEHQPVWVLYTIHPDKSVTAKLVQGR